MATQRQNYYASRICVIARVLWLNVPFTLIAPFLRLPRLQLPNLVNVCLSAIKAKLAGTARAALAPQPPAQVYSAACLAHLLGLHAIAIVGTLILYDEGRALFPVSTPRVRNRGGAISREEQLTLGGFLRALLPVAEQELQLREEAVASIASQTMQCNKVPSGAKACHASEVDLQIGLRVTQLLQELASRNARSRAVLIAPILAADTPLPSDSLLNAMVGLVLAGVEAQLTRAPPAFYSAPLRSLLDALGRVASAQDGVYLFLMADVGEEAQAAPPDATFAGRLIQKTMLLLDHEVEAAAAAAAVAGTAAPPSPLLVDLLLVARLFVSIADGLAVVHSCGLQPTLCGALNYLGGVTHASPAWVDALVGVLAAFTQTSLGVLLLDAAGVLDESAAWLRHGYIHGSQISCYQPYGYGVNVAELAISSSGVLALSKCQLLGEIAAGFEDAMLCIRDYDEPPVPLLSGDEGPPSEQTLRRALDYGYKCLTSTMALYTLLANGSDGPAFDEASQLLSPFSLSLQTPRAPLSASWDPREEAPGANYAPAGLLHSAINLTLYNLGITTTFHATESQTVALNLVFLAATNLNNACLLRGIYRADIRLIERLAETGAPQDDGREAKHLVVIDEVMLLRLRLLAVLTVVGGPSERCLPPMSPPESEDAARLLARRVTLPLGQPWDRLAMRPRGSVEVDDDLAPALESLQQWSEDMEDASDEAAAEVWMHQGQDSVRRVSFGRGKWGGGVQVWSREICLWCFVTLLFLLRTARATFLLIPIPTLD